MKEMIKNLNFSLPDVTTENAFAIVLINNCFYPTTGNSSIDINGDHFESEGNPFIVKISKNREQIGEFSWAQLQDMQDRCMSHSINEWFTDSPETFDSFMANGAPRTVAFFFRLESDTYLVTARAIPVYDRTVMYEAIEVEEAVL